MARRKPRACISFSVGITSLLQSVSQTPWMGGPPREGTGRQKSCVGWAAASVQTRCARLYPSHATAKDPEGSVTVLSLGHETSHCRFPKLSSFSLLWKGTPSHCNVRRRGNFKFLIKAGELLAQATGKIFEGEGQQHFFIWFQQIPKKRERKEREEEGTWGGGNVRNREMRGLQCSWRHCYQNTWFPQQSLTLQFPSFLLC